MNARNQRRLYALKYDSTVSNEHCLEVDKTVWYRDYYDNEDYEKVFLRSRGVTLLLCQRRHIVAFREDNTYYVVDR